MKITISHPHGNPNSFHAARAFAEAHWLRSFQRGFAGNRALAAAARGLPGDALDRLGNRRLEGVPAARQRPHLLWEAAARLGTRLRPAGPTARVNWYDLLFCGHDLQVSKELEGDLDAVYAYEDGARRTFAAAKRGRAAAVYELPLGYYAGVAHELERARRERPGLSFGPHAEPDWKRRRKDAELELADVVVVPCAWAEASLSHSKAGARKAVVKIPYGTPADEVAVRGRPADAPFTILFAGQIGLRKGVPHLVEAWRRLKLKDARLWLAGSINLGEAYLAEGASSFEYLGRLPRVKLFEVMRRADLLVFPSLAEGFGLVIGEAMALGLPVLTTTNTGGTELITDGRDGLLVPAHDADALAARVEWAARNRDRLFEMGLRARERAEQWTWGHYRRALVGELSKHLN
ncbi:MAG TPA: glycosyltransferase family 4 protein [Pyrinomonadaceae bacterium]|nr:glycosyltransferase family 4 protein [Pyrinomonadaceae bacterium]